VSRRARRRIVGAFLIATLVVVAGGWAIPTFAGRAFVDVRARIVPIAADPVPGLAIVLPDGSAAASGRLRIDIAITNRYPLPVLIDFRGSAFHATLTRPDSSSRTPVWKTSADDPALEQADESPSGAGSARVVLLAPGTTLLSLSSSDMTLDLATMAAVDPGTYSLRVSAYGIGSSPQPLGIVASGADVPREVALLG
jgi:hypothetical protein